MKKVGVNKHARLGVGTIIQDYRYLGEGKQLALRTELFCTYMEPLSRVSRGKAGEADTGKRYYQYRCWRMCPLVDFLPMDVSNDRSPWYSGGA
jgi:hypothetical protein